MNLRKIQLDFIGPYSIQTSEKAEHKKCVYLHCTKIDDNSDYYICYYVGQSKDFIRRQGEHKNYYKNVKYSVWKIDNQELNIKYIPGYDIYDEVNLNPILDEMIKATKIFYAPIINDNDNPEEIEGAIQIHLWRNEKTRKYLISLKPPIYNFKNGIITMNFPNNEKILGLEKDIIVNVL